MPNGMNLDLKRQVRGELFRCAVRGEFPTYAEFFNRIRPGGTMGRFPYQVHFDAIAKEERSLGYPDITFIVRGVDGYPHQIEFDDARVPNAAQLDNLRKGTDEIIRLYCPVGTPNPYRR
jgi:hypothetical protein